MARLHLSCLLLFVLACSGEPASIPDGGDASTGMDARVPDASSDAPDAASSGECISARLASFRLSLADDVSIIYRARIEPDIDGQPWDLYLEFNRYEVEYVGEFPLGTGTEASYGGCARCVVAFYGSMFDRALFARAGTLILRDDPFTHRLDATLRDVRLQEVMVAGPTLESVPVPGGVCVTLEETHIDGTFPPPGWRCEDTQYNDDTTCHCGCGVPDPDCGSQCPFPLPPSCDPTPLPIQGCPAGNGCTYEGECFAPCDHPGRSGCASGVCGPSHAGDRCFAVDEVDDAVVGERCEGGPRLCAVDGERFAMGVCDGDEDWLCRAMCDDDEDCTLPGDACVSAFYDPLTGYSRGYCRPAPPACAPSGSECSAHSECCSVLCEGLGGSRQDGGARGTCA